MGLTKDDLVVGKWYRAKRHLESAFSNNDRQIVYLSSDKTQVQYDGDTVKMGQRRPVVDVEKFLKWAERVITQEELTEYNKKHGS